LCNEPCRKYNIGKFAMPFRQCSEVPDLQSTALRHFLEVVRTGSIAEASARLNVAASAVSRRIAALEAELGVELFERRPRGMVASPAGELLARHATRVFLEEEAVVFELRRLQGLATGVVRVAATEGFGIDLLPEAIEGFRRRFPGIRFALRIDAPANVTRLVRDGDVDLGMTFVFAPEPGVRVQFDGLAPIMILMAPDHPLASREKVVLADLVGHAVALPERDTTARQLFDIACGLAGVAIEPVMTTNYMNALWTFAEVGGGVTVTGRMTALSRIRRFRLVARPISSEAIAQRRWEVQTMLGRRLPDAVEAFLGHLRATLGERETWSTGQAEG
jgi:DNA-binding transcriptional LysR family regulator